MRGAGFARLAAGAFVLATAAMPGSASAQALHAAAPAMSGTVFEDRNGNGVRDAGEPGVAGVRISNGRELVASAADGSYRIAIRPEAPVFAIKPPDRAFGRRADGLPASWSDDASHPFDIALSPRRALRGPMQVLLFTDPQVKSETDVGYYRRDILEPLRGTAARLGLTLGDLGDDAPQLYPSLNAATASLGLPWLHVAGNHDVDAGATDDATSLRAFHASYGPDTVAWEEPGATVVGLDDIVAMPGQRPAYVGGLREDQFAFLEAYLPTVPKDRLLVIGAHIPFFDANASEAAARGAPPTFRPADRERLFALLRDFPHVLLLSGHTHNQQNFFHDASDGWHGAQPLHEYNVGAACGAFWSGVKDAEGIPDSTMSDGTPNGHAVLTVQERGDYALAWHNARDAADSQIGLWAPKALRRGAYPAWGVYANVYMGDDGTRVEYRIDGGEWKAMRRVPQPDPRLLAENAKDDTADALRGYDRSPEATPSKHLWRGALATDLATGEHRVEVRAFDRWRGEVRAGTTYRLQDAGPAD